MAPPGVRGRMASGGRWEAAGRDPGPEEALRPDPEIDALLREAELTHDRARLRNLAPELLDRLVTAGRRAEALRLAGELADRLPEDASFLERAARLFEEGGRTPDAIRSRQRLDAVLPPGQRLPNLLRLGELLRRTGRRREAEAAFRTAAGLAPRDPGPAGLLASLFEEEGRIEEATRWLLRQAERSRGPARAACLLHAAELEECELGDPSRAAATLARLGQGDPLPDPELDARIDALLLRAGRLAELAERLARRRDRLPEGDPAAIPLDLRLGELLERLGRPTEAARAWRAVLRHRPDSRQARAGLDRVLRASADPACRLEQTELALAEAEGSQKRLLRLGRAALLEGELGRFDEAEAVYREIEAGDDEVAGEARRRLESLLERRGAIDELASRLEGRLKEAAPEEAAALHERLAALEEWHRRRPAAAARHLRAALRLRPGCTDLRRRLVALEQGTRGATGAVARLLEELGAEPPPTPAREIEIRVGILLRRREAGVPPDGVREHCARILELEPGHPVATAVWLELLGPAGPPAERARLLEARLARLLADDGGAPATAAAERLSVRVRLAGILWRELGDPAGAIAHLEAARAESGPVAVVAEPLADLYRATGRVAPLLLLCREAAGAADVPEERALWWVRLADELLRRGEQGPALEAYRRALVEQPGHAGAEEALRDLYRRRGDAEGLARLLDAALARTAGPREVPLRLELAELLGGPLGRPHEALEQLRRAVEVDPSDLPLLRHALSLARRLRRDGDREHLLGLAVAAADDPAERAELLAERGLLRARGGASEAAAADLEAALALEPGLGRAREALGELRLAEGRVEEALELLSDAEATDPGGQRSNRLRLADLAFERLPPDRALPWLERAVAVEPREPGLRARIAEIHWRAGRPEACVRWLREQLALVREPTGRRSLQHRIALLLADDLGRPVEAARMIEAALAEHGDDPELLFLLARVRQQAGQPREHAGALRRLLAALPPAGRVPVRRELARICAGPLHDPAGAARELAMALAEAPAGAAGRSELLRELAACRRRAGDLAGAAESAEAELALLRPDAPVFAERRFRLRCELAALYRDELGRPDRAHAHLRAALEEAPATCDVEEAELALIELLEQCDFPVELARRLEARIAAGRGGLREQLALARVREQGLGLPAAAAAAWREALRIAPDRLDAIRGLRRCAQSLDDAAEQVRMLEAELAHPETREPSLRAALYRELGVLCYERLGATTRATRALAAALEADPSDLESLRRLEEILEAVEDWRGALDLLRSELDVLGSREPARRFEIWLRIADLARLRCGDPEGALAALEAAAGLDALPPTRLAERVDLARAVRDPARLASALAAWCDHPEVAPRAASLVELARTLREAGRPHDAGTRLQQALALDPDHLPAFLELAELGCASGDALGAARALESAAERAPAVQAARHLERAARLLEPADPCRALDLLQRARERDPAAGSAAAAEARLAHRLGRTAAAWRAARAALDLDPEGHRLAGAERAGLARMAAAAARDCGELEAALELCHEALRAEPGDPPLLELRADLLAALGEAAEGARVAEARVTRPGGPAPRPEDLRRAAEARAARGDLRGALSLLDGAVTGGESCVGLLELRMRLCVEAGREEEALRCARKLADAAAEPAERAARLVEAARICRTAGGDPVPLLEEALRTDPDHGGARLELGLALEAAGMLSRALDVLRGDGRLLGAAGGEAAARLEAGIRILGRLGRRREASRCCELLLAENPDRVDIALLRARLDREEGRFEDAARGLARFAATANAVPATAQARVLVELGRLRAGPLGDTPGAREAFRRALDLDPGCEVAEAELADLLVELPDATPEALARHLALLDRHPTRPASLRALHRIAVREGPAEAAAAAAELLRALARPDPASSDAPPTAPAASGRLRVVDTPGLEDPLHERLRRMAVSCAREISKALGASEGLRRATTGDGDFLAACLVTEQELCGAALVPLSDEEFAGVLSLVASLALGSDPVRGDGRLVNALARALGRRARRRARRCLGDLSADLLGEVDFADLRRRLRGLAAALAVDRSGLALAAALDALCRTPEPGPEAAAPEFRRDAVERDPVASDLVRRVARAVAREVAAP